MNNRLIISGVFYVALFSVFFSSCSSTPDEYNDFPEVNLPVNLMNTVIQIEELTQFGNSHLNNDFLGIHVKNLSQETILFDVDSFVQLFIRSDGDWISVTNNMHYSGESQTLYPPEVVPPGMVIDIVPYIPEMDVEQTIRIIVIGHYKLDEAQLVGAYLDVTIYP